LPNGSTKSGNLNDWFHKGKKEKRNSNSEGDEIVKKAIKEFCKKKPEE